jgi:AMP deaminase
MKRIVSYQEFIKSPRGTSIKNFSPTLPPNDQFNPHDPLHKEKSLRSAPRKISNVEDDDFDKFDRWLRQEEQKKEQKADFKLQERKAQPEKIISEIDQEMLHSNPPIYRKITFTPIPSQFKPQYEKEETFLACTNLEELMSLRKKYIMYDENIHQHPFLRVIRPSEVSKVFLELSSIDSYSYSKGLFHFPGINLPIITKKEFYLDMQLVIENIYNTSNKSFCYLRLKMLLMKFNIHLQCNVDREALNQKVHSRKDFYTIVKVDNHVHLSTCMNQKHLQKFIKVKLKEEPNTKVHETGETSICLNEVTSHLGFDSSTLTVDVVDSYNSKSEKYGNKYNPLNRLTIKDIFLSIENHIQGRFFAELVKEVIKGIDKEKYVLAEYRISIFGKQANDWETTAKWLKTYEVSSKRIRWLVQIPRLFSEFKKKALVSNFSEMLFNIFNPIFEATLHPEKHPEIHQFLKKVVGFDLVNDEEKNEKIKSYINYKIIDPEDWSCDEEPTYSYWSYYLFTNIGILNHLRRARGMNTFAYRPHCGEAGSNDHLAVGYLMANSINHGIKLSKIPVLQYLFYLDQIGLSLSPLSNNKHFIKFLKNPLLKFFNRGLNVSLSTDDPLSTHLTREPLMEEYSVAAQTLDFNTVDLCEIARNSVFQSGFCVNKKKSWLGQRFLEGENDPSRTNVSTIRHVYRLETFIEEHKYLMRHAYNDDEI